MLLWVRRISAASRCSVLLSGAGWSELAQENGTDSGALRPAFLVGGAVITDELKQRHIARMVLRELVRECDNMAELLSFELDNLKGDCELTARGYRQAHHDILSQYAEHELDIALRENCIALVRAMKLSILVKENPLANTIGHEGYVEAEHAVMQQVKTWVEQAVRGCNIRLTDEPVLFKTGLSASTLLHMELDVAATPVQRKVCGNVRPNWPPQCRNIRNYCWVTMHQTPADYSRYATALT